jgi:hypothetical protein
MCLTIFNLEDEGIHTYQHGKLCDDCFNSNEIENLCKLLVKKTILDFNNKKEKTDENIKEVIIRKREGKRMGRPNKKTPTYKDSKQGSYSLEYRREYIREYYNKNKDKECYQKNKEDYYCETCDSFCLWGNRNAHFKTKTHKNQEELILKNEELKS